jgi:hypothetical protein
MLKDLLKGQNHFAQQLLDDLLGKPDLNILWYPSAENDYRDLFEFHPQIAAERNIHSIPDIFIHTSYDPGNLHHLQKTGGARFNNADNDTDLSVSIHATHLLVLSNPSIYQVERDFVDLPENAYPIPIIHLLDVSVTSRIRKISNRKWVIYFLFENINFLENVLLRGKVPVSHVVKVREGIGTGGARKSIILLYAFLSALKVRYLTADIQCFDFDYLLKDKIAEEHELRLENYDLKRLGTTIWSGLDTNFFEIAHRTDGLDDGRIMDILTIIRE